MARFAIASSFGCGLSWWRRLVDEGHEVLVWCDPGKPGEPTGVRNVGNEIVPKASGWGELFAWSKASRAPTLMYFDSSGLGEKADEARKSGLYVVGGGKVCDDLENNRAFGFNVAERAGATLPPYETFNNIEECLAYAGTIGDQGVFFKTDQYLKSDATKGTDNGPEMQEYLQGLMREVGKGGKCLLQKTIEGVAVSTSRYWDGRAWFGPFFGTIERKKFMSGDIGPATGCSLNAIWTYDDEYPEIARSLCWENLTAEFLRLQMPPGTFDINAILHDGDAYMLEWCGRAGYDSEPTGQLLYKDLGALLWRVGTGQGDGGGFYERETALSVRLSVPPYPIEEIKMDDAASPVGIQIRGEVGSLYSQGFIGYQLAWDDERELHVAAPEGIVGLSAARGDAVSDLAEQVLEFAKEKLRVDGLQYRDDPEKAICHDAEEAASAGFSDLPESLVC